LHTSSDKTVFECWRECEEKGTSYTAGDDVNWCSHYGEQYGGSLKKPKIELSYDPVILLLGTYPEKTLILVSAPLCSEQHYLQEPRYGNNLSDHQ